MLDPKKCLPFKCLQANGSHVCKAVNPDSENNLYVTAQQ